MVDENSVYINVTKNIPNLQAWFTTIGHYENMPLEINTAKNLDCDQLGEKLRVFGQKDNSGVVYQELHGILPQNDDFKQILDDIVLYGKLVFFERGMIFVDQKLNSIVMPFSLLEQMVIYQETTNEMWLEINMSD
jgi:hypothetical protein